MEERKIVIPINLFSQYSRFYVADSYAESQVKQGAIQGIAVVQRWQKTSQDFLKGYVEFWVLTEANYLKLYPL